MAVTRFPGANMRDFWFMMVIGVLVVAAVALIGYVIATGG